jgi:uncharacterized protein YraI
MQDNAFTRNRRSHAVALQCVILFNIYLLLQTNALAQVVLTAGKTVKVHSGPSLNSKRIGGLKAGEKVKLSSPRGRGTYAAPRNGFFDVHYGEGQTGWVSGNYLYVPDIETRTINETGAEMVMAPEEFNAAAETLPLCGTAAHYRWLAKTETSGFNNPPTSASVNAVLHWTPLPFKGHGISSWCNERVSREAKTFSVLGYVRRIRKETDGDVHIEITQKPTDAVENCAVVEIPAAELSPRFKTARTTLADLLSVTELNDHDFDSPRRLRFSGLAFWDGWHATSGLPSKHGRCNSTVGAAWELHPVFQVAAP